MAEVEVKSLKRSPLPRLVSNGRGMAKPNYSGEKRSKDHAKKAKKEEKRLRKLEPKTESAGESADAPAAET